MIQSQKKKKKESETQDFPKKKKKSTKSPCADEEKVVWDSSQMYQLSDKDSLR